MILDEGGAIVSGKIPGITTPVAAVGIAETGYLDVELCATGEEGHSSSPPEATSVAIVSEAVDRLTTHPRARRRRFQATKRGNRDYGITVRK